MSPDQKWRFLLFLDVVKFVSVAPKYLDTLACGTIWQETSIAWARDRNVLEFTTKLNFPTLIRYREIGFQIRYAFVLFENEDYNVFWVILCLNRYHLFAAKQRHCVLDWREAYVDKETKYVMPQGWQLLGSFSRVANV